MNTNLKCGTFMTTASTGSDDITDCVLISHYSLIDLRYISTYAASWIHRNVKLVMQEQVDQVHAQRVQSVTIKIRLVKHHVSHVAQVRLLLEQPHWLHRYNLLFAVSCILFLLDLSYLSFCIVGFVCDSVHVPLDIGA
jgi:hypothetical protein